MTRQGEAMAEAATGRAGRNLPVAIVVGLALGAAVLVPVYTYKPVFVGVVALFAGLGTTELVTSLRAGGLNAPLPPLLAGGTAMVLLGYLRGTEAVTVAAMLTVVAVTLWRLVEPPEGLLGDLAGALFALAYVPFLAVFTMLLLAPPDGADREVAFVATVVCSDVGGYAAGVLFGRHPLAPAISPKKSWEGLAGSVVACSAAGAAFFGLLLHAPPAEGVAYGLAVVCTAVLGDLGESMIKRDLGIKDMGALLPGHGGVMDRVDALLLTAPVAYLLLRALVPGG